MREREVVVKITVYSSKGSAGKTPISFNIARERDWYVGTNEIEHVFDLVLPEDQVMAIEPEEEFPEFPPEIDIVFDLAGSLSRGNSPSILSAVKQSDLLIVPMWSEVKSIRGGLFSIRELQPHAKNILVVATKIRKQKREAFGEDWQQSNDYQNVAAAVKETFGGDIPVLPLKYSEVFDTIFDRNQSITQICDAGMALERYAYRVVREQFQKIFDHIDEVDHGR